MARSSNGALGCCSAPLRSAWAKRNGCSFCDAGAKRRCCSALAAEALVVGATFTRKLSAIWRTVASTWFASRASAVVPVRSSRKLASTSWPALTAAEVRVNSAYSASPLSPLQNNTSRSASSVVASSVPSMVTRRRELVAADAKVERART